MKGWTVVSNKKKDFKKELKNYENGKFKNIIEATDYLIFSISKGQSINELTSFQISLLHKRYGEKWKDHL